MTRPRILLSNDDGYLADGINALAAQLRDVGDVWMVAPDRERSAASHAISLHKPLRIRELSERRYAVDGTPSDCVYLALHHIMDGPPDIVLSGVNHGANLGTDVIYSGTVSAAMEGAVLGYRAVAVSLCLPESEESPAAPRFDTAARVACEVARSALDRPMPSGVLLNVNVPNRHYDDLMGIKLCRLGFTQWTDNCEARFDPRGRPYYWIGGERCGHDDIPDSDNNCISEGAVSVTPVHYDVTDYRSFDYVRGLPLNVKRLPDALGSGPVSHVVSMREARGRWQRK